MSDEKHRVWGTLVFNDDESFEAYRNGDGTFNNGLRRDDGTLYRQPDFEEHNKDDESDDEYSTSSKGSSSDNLAKIIISLLGLGVVAIKVAPKVKHWYNISVAPTIKTKWNKFRGKEAQKAINPSTVTEIATVVKNDDELLAVCPQQIDEAYEGYRRNITSEEAQKELLEMFILSALLAKKIRIFSDSNIVGGELLIEKLTSKEYIEGVNQILVANSNLLEEKADILSEIIGRAICEEGVYVPIECEMLKHYLRI